MPLKTPFSSLSKKSKAGSRKRGKSSSRNKGKSPTKRGRVSPHASRPPEPVSFSWWDTLSDERKLDVVGAIMAVAGISIVLVLFSPRRSESLEIIISVLSRSFGWGIYILTFGLIAMGVWLILRRIEKLPPLTLERATGIIILFLWLLATMHFVVAAPSLADQAAMDGAGGGYIGSVFEKFLFNYFGMGGSIVALLAWLFIAVTMTFDIEMQDLFKWVTPFYEDLRERLTRRLSKDNALSPEDAEVASNGFTPLHRPEPVVNEPPAIGTPVTTVRPAEAVIHWQLPDVKNILIPGSAPEANEEFIQQRARLIEETLASFGAPVQVVEINRGPAITQFGVEPQFVETRSGRTKVRVNKIASLADDLALALAAPRIRIQAPVPGHSYVGIEVPNDEMTLVALRDIVESEIFQRNKNPMKFALGEDVTGHPVSTTLENMPHLLIAGTTGSGKSVCVNAILSCLLLHNTPDELKLILVDPKRVELTGYNGIPHLLSPVVVEVKQVISVLQWVTREMDSRYHKFSQIGARNITEFNARMKLQEQKRLPFLVVVIDELADLMMISPTDTEQTITRLAQLARATGIHMVLATQRPSVDVVTGLIKANFPARVAFAVASNTDSRVILDQPGAERLLGRGDMLFQAPDAPAPVRLQGVFVSDHEIQNLVDFWKGQLGGASPYAAPSTPSDIPRSGVPLKQTAMFDEVNSEDANIDPLFAEAVDLVRREGRASVSMLQRRLRIGYTRAARLVDMMEDKGIVGPPEGGTQMRQILDYGPTAPPKDDGA
ncbi:MAG TPA: DNA translocase FtsK [Anaerolineales bacterium]